MLFYYVIDARFDTLAHFVAKLLWFVSLFLTPVDVVVRILWPAQRMRHTRKNKLKFNDLPWWQRLKSYVKFEPSLPGNGWILFEESCSKRSSSSNCWAWVLFLRSLSQAACTVLFALKKLKIFIVYLVRPSYKNNKILLVLIFSFIDEPFQSPLPFLDDFNFLLKMLVRLPYKMKYYVQRKHLLNKPLSNWFQHCP